MASILKVKAKWSGFNGSPGYSNFFFRDFAAGEPTSTEAEAAAVRVATFFGAVKSLFPAAVKIDIPGDIEVIEETNGQLKNILSVPPRAQIAGTAAAAGYSAASGAVVNWRTPGVRNGRRVRGRTFLVPTANIAFATTGELQASTVTTISTAATALVDAAGSPDLGVWARPSAPGATDGIWYACNAATVPTLAAVLRSRRD